jgi:CRP-like cAMP-binding protein
LVPIKHANDYLSGLRPEIQADLGGISLERFANAGEVLLRAGQPCFVLYQLLEGEVECHAPGRRGSVSIAATLGKDDWLGLLEAVSGLPAMANVIATTPVRLRAIQSYDFEALLTRHPALSRRVLRLFSISLSAVYHQMNDRDALPLRERLLRALYILSFTNGKALRQQGVLIEIPQAELSQRLSAARQTVNRQLKQLEREGLIRVNYRSITVLGLQHWAEHQVST